MSSASAPIDILRQALVLLGHKPATTINDQSPNAVAFGAIYETIVEDAMLIPGWKFCRTVARLAFQDDVDLGNGYVYALPSDILRPVRVEIRGRRYGDYELLGDRLLAPIRDELDLVYVKRVSEGEWPGDFIAGVVRLVASQLPFGAREIKAQLAAQGEGKLLQGAGREHNMGQGAPRDVDSDLVRAWLNRPRVTRREHQT